MGSRLPDGPAATGSARPSGSLERGPPALKFTANAAGCDRARGTSRSCFCRLACLPGYRSLTLHRGWTARTFGAGRGCMG